jgi:hypothetical protein
MTRSLIISTRVDEDLAARIDLASKGQRSKCVRAAVEEKLSGLEEGEYRPKTELGRKLVSLRQKYLKKGGMLSTLEEINQEAARRRGREE